MKLKQITIEGMHNIYKATTYTLPDIIYFHGDNGVGKSTILQAIQLALLGYIPGTNKTKEAIFRHANGRVLAVTLIVEDGDTLVTIERSWMSTKSSIVSDFRVTPDYYDVTHLVSDVELPIFNFTEFLSLTPNKLKDWFIEFLPSIESHVDWTSVLSQVEGTIDPDLIADAVRTIQSYNLSGTDEIRKANEYFKSMISLTKKEISRVQDTIGSLIYYDTVDPTLSSAVIESKIAEVIDKKKIQDGLLKIAQQNESIKTTLSMYTDCTCESVEVDPRYVECSNNVYDLTVKIDSYSNMVTTNQETMYVLNDKLSVANHRILELEHILSGSGICPYTDSKCEFIQNKLDAYTQELDELNSTVPQISTELNDLKSKTSQLRADIQNWIVARNDLTLKMNKLKDRYVAKASLKLKLRPEPAPLTNVEDYDAQLNELYTLQAQYLANEKYRSMIDTLTADKFKLDAELNIYKAWSLLTDVNGLQTSAGDTSPFSAFESILDTFLSTVLGKESHSCFHLDGKSNSFSFGLLQDSTYRSYNLLSSGEKCIYSICLLLGLVKLSKSPLKLLMIDDSFDHLDDTAMAKLFNSLVNISDNIQMIFAGVKSVESEYTVELTA